MSSQRFRNFVAALVLVLATTTSVVVESLPAAAATSAPDRTTASPARATDSAAPVLVREVFGFALLSSLGDASLGYPSWNFSTLSTVAVFGLHVNTAGKIAADSSWSQWNSSAMSGLLTKAHAHGTKVVVTMVLQDFATGNPTMCAGLANRSVTVAQTVAQVLAKHVDGVNVDYEGLNSTCANGQTTRAMLTDFVRRLRAALPRGANVSVDTYASSAADPRGFFDVRGISSYVDSFFVMAYDLEYSNWHRAPLSCTRFCLGPTSPASGYYYNDATTAQQYKAVVPASKIILGVPYYGRASCVASVAPNAYPTGAVTAVTYLNASDETSSPDVQAGSYATHRDANDPRGSPRWDTWVNTSMGCTRELYWDDAQSLAAKYRLSNALGLRGVGIWTLNYGGGAAELWTNLTTYFTGCSAVVPSVSPPSPQLVGTSITIGGAATGCATQNPLYRFWMMRPGSSTWELARDFSATPTYVWSTSGLRSGTYRFSVLARNSGGPGRYSGAFGAYDAFAQLTVTLTSSPCVSVAATAAPAGGQMAGTLFTVSAHAAGCPNPQYQFWVLAPGATRWQLARDYAVGSALTWSSGAKPAGRYRWSVFARDASSAGRNVSALGRYDAFVNAVFTTVTPGCASVHLTVSPSGSVPSGATITLTGAAAGCLNANPMYAFWVLGPGSSRWLLAQPYSTASTFAWKTQGLAAGAYRVAVWTHDASNSGVYSSSLGPYDAFSDALPVTLTPTCSAVTVTSSPASSTRVGATVIVTGAASGCPSPVYEFWVLAPGASTWQLARGYGAASFAWSTAGKPKGVYRFSVWARDAGSRGAFTIGLGSYDAFNADRYLTLT
jgi:spore germination protein YaaH